MRERRPRRRPWVQRSKEPVCRALQGRESQADCEAQPCSRPRLWGCGFLPSPRAAAQPAGSAGMRVPPEAEGGAAG